MQIRGHRFPHTMMDKKVATVAISMASEALLHMVERKNPLHSPVNPIDQINQANAYSSTMVYLETEPKGHTRKLGQDRAF